MDFFFSAVAVEAVGVVQQPWLPRVGFQCQGCSPSPQEAAPPLVRSLQQLQGCTLSCLLWVVYRYGGVGFFYCLLGISLFLNYLVGIDYI